MLRIDGEELLLNKNQGPMGLWAYDKIFNKSLTDELYKLLSDLNNFKIDAILFYKIVYILSGYEKKYTFETFLSKVPTDYDFSEDYEKVIEKALNTFFPKKREEEETPKEEQ